VDYSRADAFFSPFQAVTVDLNVGTATDQWGGSDSLANIENVNGSDLGDQITGSAAGNRISGFSGDDVISGEAGDDNLFGDNGDDTLSGGAGSDRLTGGQGADTFVVVSGDEQVQITDFERGIDTIDLSDFSLQDGQFALANAALGSAILTFSDGTVLTIDGVSPDDLSESDFVFGALGSNTPPLGLVLISGDTSQGSSVLADISGLSDIDIIRPETIAYQWQRDGADIADANQLSYTITTEDLGAALSVVVSYTDEGGTSEQATSAPVSPFLPGQDKQGTSGNDPLNGTAGDETLEGLGGDDTLTGLGGDDTLAGGEGTDTAVFSGPQTSYTLTLSPNGSTIVDRRPDGNGTDTLIDVEFLDFDTDLFDGPFDLQQFGGPTGLSQADFESFIELYIAYFNRAPDAVGLNFWGTAFATGTTLTEIAMLFIEQDETRATYPLGQSNLEFATAVYNNVLGRTPDQAGLNFWEGQLNSGGVSRDAFILEVLRGAKADPQPDAGPAFIEQQLADRQYLSDKTDLGAYFSVILGMSDVENAGASLALFNGSPESIDTAIAEMDRFFAEAQDAQNGEFLMPLVGVLDDPFSV
ncbi:MAG: DUF4214 domain-containing protein, partial [Pseudomonadota bacterium]